jgi:hypothetical protein
MSTPSIDRETIHDKLCLLGTVAGLMADHPENFGKIDRYAMQGLLYDIAKEVDPEWNEGKGEA